MPLKSALTEQKETIRRRVPNFIMNYMQSLIDQLKNSGPNTQPLGVGDTFPNGVFLNSDNKEIILSDYLMHDRAIISFYRGAWCPYCNLELRAYDAILKEDENSDVTMIAISPEQPDETLDKVDLVHLSFSVLSDVDNAFAKRVGLVFKTTKLLRILYRFDGINLKHSQGNNYGELPIPATYVINSNSIITHAWIDADYTKRAEPSDVIEALKKTV